VTSTQTVPTVPLSRERVLRTGLTLVNAEGLAALTMRRLAADLGVGAMSIYRYVDTKHDLLDGITQIALESLARPANYDGSWDEQLSTAIGDLYSALRAHPGATQILANGLVPGPALDPIRDSLLGILRGAGFNKAHAVTYLHTLLTYAVGFAVVAGHREATSANEALRLGALPSETFANLADSASEFSSCFSRHSFDAGLRLIIEGLQAHLTG
jgi:AcrR family transcriptional regulator